MRSQAEREETRQAKNVRSVPRLSVSKEEIVCQTGKKNCECQEEEEEIIVVSYI